MTHGTIETIDDLRGPAGHLEALLNRGTIDAPYAGIVCHPHPPSGGTMHTKAVYHAAKALNSFGFPVLRFNFRGVGISDGSYTNGPGEIEDVKAAIEWTYNRYQKPVLLAGFSFGSNMAFRASCGDTRVHGVIGLGTPLEAEGRQYTYEFLSHCTQPRLFVTGAEDSFAPHDQMEALLKQGTAPTEMVWVPGADHFFAGTPTSPASKLSEMRTAIEDWIAKTFHVTKLS